MSEAYIVEAVRTAGGRSGGKLAGWHPADLGAQVVNALVDRTGLDPAAIEDVVLGCVTQAGEQAFALAQCGSRLQTAGQRTGRDHRSAVRVLPAGDPFCRAGGDV